MQSTTMQPQSPNLRKYTSANPLRRWLISRFYQTARGLLAQAATAGGHCRTLDAGCGEGLAMRLLWPTGAPCLVGLDATGSALRLAGALNPACTFVAGDVRRLPFADQSFDLVVCLEVLEHIDEPAPALAELCRVSRRWLLLSVPNEPLFQGANLLGGNHLPTWGNAPGHINHWSARSFVHFVAASCRVVAWRQSFPWTLVLGQVATTGRA